MESLLENNYNIFISKILLSKKRKKSYGYYLSGMFLYFSIVQQERWFKQVWVFDFMNYKYYYIRRLLFTAKKCLRRVYIVARKVFLYPAKAHDYARCILPVVQRFRQRNLFFKTLLIIKNYFTASLSFFELFFNCLAPSIRVVGKFVGRRRYFIPTLYNTKKYQYKQLSTWLTKAVIHRFEAFLLLRFINEIFEATSGMGQTIRTKKQWIAGVMGNRAYIRFFKRTFRARRSKKKLRMLWKR